MKKPAPIINAPMSVKAALAVIVAAHLARLALAEETDAWLVLALAFIPARYDGYAEALPGGSLAAAWSFFTHALLHGGAAHLMLNGAWLLVFGAAVAERIGGWRFLALSLMCAAAGAGAFLLANPGPLAPMIGASGAVSGLMGGAFRFMFSALDQGGLHLLRTAPASVRLQPLAEALRDPRVIAFTGAWLAINLLSALGVSMMGEGAVAWEAHLGGFALGFLGFDLFERRRGRIVAPPDKLP